MYGYKREVNSTFEATVPRLKEELGKEGFGVMSEIDVQSTIKKKLNIDFNKYLILGVCNPPFAHQALQAEMDMGLMLPCNTIVYEKEGKTFIASILPTVVLSVIKNDKLSGIAGQVEAKLKKAIDSV